MLALVMLELSRGYSQTNDREAKNDPEAKKILDAISAKFKSYKAVTSDFTLKIEDAKGKVQGEKKGKVYMKDKKYRVDITGQEIYSDGATVWTFDQAANEVTINTVDPSGSGITPQKLFTSFYDKDFLYKFNGEKKQGGAVLQEIEMTPVDKTKAFHKVYLTVNKKTHNVVSTRVFEKNGNKYTYSVNSLDGQSPVAEDLFVFNKGKHPGVEEVDLR